MNLGRMNLGSLKANSPKVNSPMLPTKTNAYALPTSFMNTSKNGNTLNSSLSKSLNDALYTVSRPIKDSISSAYENETSPMISIPIIIALGLFVILFVVVIIFKDQVLIALEILLHYLKKLFTNEDKPLNVEPGKPIEMKENELVDKSAIENAMPTIRDQLPNQKQVFNIAQDKYKYSDAEPLCKAFGAELATHDQVKEAWKKGADWCNYGWIKGQSAVFPTQQSTYDKLQTGPEEQRGACGVPGVNGGYFDNPDLRFGVNCYGVKPSENDTDDRELMKGPALTPETLEYNKKVRDFKADMTEIPVNPFSEGRW